MKFLIDENLPPSLAILLKNVGHEARHVFQVGLNNAPDFKIADFAAASGEVILTHDTDFGTILALSSDSKPSVVLFRWKKISAQILFDFLEEHLPELENALENGSFVVADEQKMRIRKLPLLFSPR